MHWGVWLARARMAFARRPWAYWVLAGGCAVVVAIQVHDVVAEARSARRAWGTTGAAWVVTAPAAAGQPIAAERRALPTAMLPEHAVDELPRGAVAAHTLAPGAVLTATDLRHPGDMPSGWLVVGVPPDRAPVLGTGDPVTLIGASGTRCDGVAIESDDAAVEVGLPPDCATALAGDLLAGDVLVTRRAG